MAVTKYNENTASNDFNGKVGITFICPICKSNKELEISKSIVKQAKSLATISIPSDIVCKHSFQAFIDKNFKVRSYQKTDFEFDKNENYDQNDKALKYIEDDNELFENLVLDGNYLEWNPQNKVEKKVENKVEKKEMSLEEIYEEFWEFIDEDNHEFREFIIKDKRRKRN